MTAWLTVSVLSVLLSVLVGWAIPAWAMRRLLPALESGGKRVTNYRGLSVPTGLGIVWLVWAAGVAALGAVASYGVLTLFANGGANALDPWFAALLTMPVRQIMDSLPLLLVVGAASFGMVDDLFGDPAAKGFRGHLRALAGGRLTTGGLKLLGIGGLSLAAALPLAQDVADADGVRWLSALTALAIWACGALVIALSANLVNLTDLRPGRALKTYSVMATLGVLIATWSSWTASGSTLAFFTGGTPSLGIELALTGGMKVSLLAIALGPVLAVWRYDLGERAMLGDAGANAMGALAGFLLAWRSPLWLLAVLAVILLALNLASERVSFSQVIERVRFLRWLDGIGRLPSDVPVSEVGAPAAAPGTGADPMRDDE
jgi:UDP-GlcNAc:undecaprenyl-phosphate GlcNAc-1-phosphate transferase